MYDVMKLRRMNDCLLMTGSDYSDVLLDAAKEIERLRGVISSLKRDFGRGDYYEGLDEGIKIGRILGAK